MSNEVLAGEVQVLLTDKLMIEASSPESDLFDLGLDSATLSQLILHLEEHFGIKLDLDTLEVENFRSARAISQLVLNQRAMGRECIERKTQMSDEIMAVEVQTLLTDMLIDVSSPETDLFGGGAPDSLTLAQLILRLEERFGIKLNLDSLESGNFRSVRSISQLVLNQPSSRTVMARGN